MSGKIQRKGKARLKAKHIRKLKEIPLARHNAPKRTPTPPNGKNAHAENASREKNEFLSFRPWRGDYVHQQLSRLPPPFDELWVISEEQPGYANVWWAWEKARKDHISYPPYGSEARERERLLYLYYLEGDSGIGLGDAQEGRKIRLAMIKRARLEGDTKFVEAVRGLQRRKKSAKGFGTGRDWVLALWIPYSLWMFDDSNVVRVIEWALLAKNGTNACGPTEQAVRRARQEFGLVNWFDLGLTQAVATFDSRGGVTLHPI